MSEKVPPQDGSRVEAEVAGERHEAIDDLEHTAAEHPAAVDLEHPAAEHPAAVDPATQHSAAQHLIDPNAGVVRAVPPDRTALLVAAAICALTLLALILVAVKIAGEGS